MESSYHELISKLQKTLLDIDLYKTGVINDPLGHTHSHASSEHCFRLFCFSRYEKWGRTYGRMMDNMCETNDPYRPRL